MRNSIMHCIICGSLPPSSLRTLRLLLLQISDSDSDSTSLLLFVILVTLDILESNLLHFALPTSMQEESKPQFVFHSFRFSCFVFLPQIPTSSSSAGERRGGNASQKFVRRTLMSETPFFLGSFSAFVLCIYLAQFSIFCAENVRYCTLHVVLSIRFLS